MAEALDNFNTSLEAHKLVKDPTKLFSLLFSKYGDILEEYQTSLINQIIFKCSTHLNTQYQEIKYNNNFLEFLRRFYKKKEIKERIPNLYEYYKNYHLFYLKPFLRNFYYVKLLHNYQDKKAEIFYKNNYSKSSNEKSNTEENSVTSSLSSDDHYTDNRIIFGTKTKLLLEGKKENNNSISVELSKIKNNEKNGIYNDLRIKIKDDEENTLNDIMKELKTKSYKMKEKDIDNENDNTQDNKITSKYKKKTDKKIKNNNNQKNSRKKNNSPKIYSKSPTFQINHQIHIIKSGNNINNNNNNNNINHINNNIKTNLINPQMYILSQKNSYSNKRNNSHKNSHFSPKMSYYIHNIASKFEEMFKKYPIYFNSMKHKKNKTGNNSINNTIKKSININNNIIGANNNFQSNFKKFSKLSASLKNSKFNITYFSQINSNNNSRSSMSAKKSNKLQKNKKIINEMNQFNIKTKKNKHKKNKTFDFNAKGRYIELKKNYTNYNLLRFNPAYSNVNKSKNLNPILYNFNIMKSPKTNFGLKNSKDSNEKSGKNSKNKRFINRKNKIFKNNKKSFISIASCSSPKFSFIMNKNEPLVKESGNLKNNNNVNISNNLNNNNNNMINNVDGNLYNFLNTNKNNISKVKKNKHRKNNISYTNNNFNINFNNIFFGSSRPISGPHANIISDNINTNGNLQINKNININNNYSINNINNLSNSNSTSLNTKKHATLIHQNNILNCKNSSINCNYNNNVSNLYIKSLNNLYNFSRNKNNKISNCSHTQTQSQSIAKNSKIIRISDIKNPATKTNSFILNNNKNIVEDKNININNNNQKKCGRVKMMNQIEDLIMKTKKHVKFGSEYKNKIGAVISNKPAFNNCNNKSKNQTKNKSNYHELFIKNLKRTSSTSIKVNTKSISNNSNNNNQAINVIYKK